MLKVSQINCFVLHLAVSYRICCHASNTYRLYAFLKINVSVTGITQGPLKLLCKKKCKARVTMHPLNNQYSRTLQNNLCNIYITFNFQLHFFMRMKYRQGVTLPNKFKLGLVHCTVIALQTK